MKKIKFLSIDQVVYLHEKSIRNFGGKPGIRDFALLNSAINIPQSTFSGKFLCINVYEMAAAYLFHLTKNHPFFDGNKRVGVLAAIVFLEINSYIIDFNPGELRDLGLAVACSKISKKEISEILKSKSYKNNTN